MALEDRRASPPGGAGLGGGAECPDAERLAEYVDGTLGGTERNEIEAHLVACSDCRAVVVETTILVRAGRVAGLRRGRLRSRWLIAGVAATLAAAAAIILVARLEPAHWLAHWFGPGTYRPELSEVVAAVASDSTRPTEARLTGGFRYALPPPVIRGTSDRELSPDIRIAAAYIQKQALAKATPVNRAALGVAQLVLGDLDQAVTAMNEAVSREPARADWLSDLSAAYLARAVREGSAADLLRARECADRATEADPTLAEARFNRAVVLEHQGSRDEARTAWEHYLKIDGNSPWSAEARRHIQALTTEKSPPN